MEYPADSLTAMLGSVSIANVKKSKTFSLSIAEKYKHKQKMKKILIAIVLACSFFTGFIAYAGCSEGDDSGSQCSREGIDGTWMWTCACYTGGCGGAGAGGNGAIHNPDGSVTGFCADGSGVSASLGIMA